MKTLNLLLTEYEQRRAKVPCTATCELVVAEAIRAADSLAAELRSILGTSDDQQQRQQEAQWEWDRNR